MPFRRRWDHAAEKFGTYVLGRDTLMYRMGETDDDDDAPIDRNSSKCQAQVHQTRWKEGYDQTHVDHSFGIMGKFYCLSGPTFNLRQSFPRTLRLLERLLYGSGAPAVAASDDICCIDDEVCCASQKRILQRDIFPQDADIVKMTTSSKPQLPLPLFGDELLEGRLVCNFCSGESTFLFDSPVQRWQETQMTP